VYAVTVYASHSSQTLIHPLQEAKAEVKRLKGVVSQQRLAMQAERRAAAKVLSAKEALERYVGFGELELEALREEHGAMASKLAVSSSGTGGTRGVTAFGLPAACLIHGQRLRDVWALCTGILRTPGGRVVQPGPVAQL
jgi:hypothetical protein